MIKTIIIISLLIILKQFLWIAFIPLWQFPDEQAHFAQVQNLAEAEQRINPKTTSREIYESEVLLGTVRDDFGNNNYTHRPQFNIPYTSNLVGEHEKTIENFPSDFRRDRVISEATGYPPLYYVLASNFYRLVYNQNFLVRAFFTRLVNLPIFLALAFIAYKVSKLIFPHQKLVQTTFVILVTFHPMLSFVSAGINSDNLYNLLFSAVLYLILRSITYGLKIKTIFLTIMTLIMAKYTKPQALLLLPISIYPIVIYLLKRKIAFLICLLLTAAYVFLFFKNLRPDLQVLPDLPPLSFFANLKITDFVEFLTWSIKHTYREIIPWYWGVFRWLSLTYPRPIHRIVNWLTVFAVLGVIVALYQSIKNRRRLQFLQIIFLIFSNLIYFLLLTIYDYLFTRSHGFPFGMQGRYYLPLVITHMALILIGLRALVPIENWRRNITIILSLGAIIWHGYAFYFITSSYFGQNFQDFIVRASQYKPWFFKPPLLEMYIITHLLSLTALLFKYILIYRSDHKNRYSIGAHK